MPMPPGIGAIDLMLTIPDEKYRKKAATILEKAEKYCLITNSMKAGSHLEAVVKVAGD